MKLAATELAVMEEAMGAGVLNPATIDAATYKQLMESRVSNNAGSNFAEVFALVSVLLSATAITAAVNRLLGLAPGSAVATGIEIALCGASVLVAITTTSAEASLQCACVAAMLMLIAIVVLRLTSRPVDTVPQALHQRRGERRRAFFSTFRGGLMLLTATCILAVDFTIFPKRHMKTETYGVSLMDTGVGCFVFSAGFAIGGKLQESSAATFSRKWLGSSIPLAVLGGARMLIIFYTDYQEHPTEYGKHWNFFCTLAVMPLLYVAIEALTDALGRAAAAGRAGMMSMPAKHLSVTRRSGFQAAVFTTSYQLLLSCTHLTSYIDSPHRRNLFEANKEGIFSSLGYVGIFLAAVELGRFMLQACPTLAKQRRIAAKALVAAALMWATMWVVHVGVQPCSRRLCNTAYVLFITALCTSFVAAFMLLEAATGEGRGTYLLEAINRNQLFVFLVANLTTGAVNLSMRTLFVSQLVACGVLSLYVVWFCGIAVVLHRANVTIKAW